MNDYLMELDPYLSITDFIADPDNYPTPAEFNNYLINTIMGIPMFATRADYAAPEVQGKIADLVYVLTSNDEKGLTALKNWFRGKTMTDLISLIAAWQSTESQAYTDISAIFDDAGLPYDSDKLENGCGLVYTLLNTSQFWSVATFLLDENKRSDAEYAIYNHAPEVTYVLLKNYSL